MTNETTTNPVVQPIAWLVAAGERDEPHYTAKARHIVGGVAGAAGNDFRRVVLEDQYRRLARHAGDASVNEFIRDQIAEHDHAFAAARRDQLKKIFCAFCGPGVHSLLSVALGLMASVASL